MSASPRRSGIGPALLGVLGIAVLAGLMLSVGVVPAVALTGMSAKGGVGLFAAIPDDLKITHLQQKTQIFAKKGGKDVLLASFYNQNREVIGWDDVPDTVKHATLAAEDVRFYEHGGVDPMGILRAIASNVTHGSTQGASTITQQYVKNVCIQEAELLPTQKQVDAKYADCTGGLKRKLREARLAIGLEKAYSKDDILLGYLNIAGFGGRIYGIESAAQYYFDTKAKDLTAAQAATLLAIVNSPAALRPDVKDNLARNKVRRDYILTNEREHGMLSKADYDEAVATPIKLKITPTTTGCAQAKAAAYFCDYVVNVIRNNRAFGPTPAARDIKMQSAGWQIHTTIDLSLEAKAKAAMTKYVPAKSVPGTDLGGAAVTVEVGTGRILSMVQSKRFDDSQGKDTKGAGYTATAVNWNTDEAYGGSGGFQPGSTYKTFTLLDWLKHGHGLYEIVDGNPRTIPYGGIKTCGAQPAAPWAVHNDEAGEGGYQTVMQATAKSVNGAYASMASKLDLCGVRDQAEALLVHRADGAPLQYTNPSSILGTNEVAPLSMATAYAGIASQGTVCKPIAIDSITDSDGKDVPVPGKDCTRAIQSSIAVAAGYALHGVLQNGTAGADRYASGSAWSFAKTGTTDDALDTWVTGGTTKTVTSVWVGNVAHVAPKKSLRLIYGFGVGGRAADIRHPLWSAITSAAEARYPGATTWAQPDAQYLYGQKVPVPDVSGKSYADAKAALQQAGFQVKKGGSTASDTVQQGMVVSSDPGANTPVTAGTKITLTISSGPQPVQTAPTTPGTVPNVVGQLIPAARTMFGASGFGNVVVAPPTDASTGPACTVIAQDQQPGTQADPSQPVTVHVYGDTSTCG